MQTAVTSGTQGPLGVEHKGAAVQRHTQRQWGSRGSRHTSPRGRARPPHLLWVSGWWPTQARAAVVCVSLWSISSCTAHWSSLLTLTAVIFTPAAALILGKKQNRGHQNNAVAAQVAMWGAQRVPGRAHRHHPLLQAA